jgi:putative peptidoglycan lipid II flippase
VIFRVCGGAALLVSAAGFMVAPALVKAMAPGFQDATFDLAVQTTRIMFPGAVFLVLAALAKASLESHKQFAVPALGPILQNIAAIAVLVAAASWGVPALAWGMLLGMGLHLFVQIPALLQKRRQHRGRAFAPVQVPALVRKRNQHRGQALSPSRQADHSVTAGQARQFLRSFFGLDNLDARQVWALFLPILLGALLGQVYIVVDRALASGLPEGSLAALTFADKLRQLPLGLFVAAISTVLSPTLSELSAKGDKRGLE